MIHNATPHTVNIYAPQTPDVIVAGEIAPIYILPRSDDLKPARIGQIDLGTHYIHGVPVEYVEFTAHGGLVHALPEHVDGVFYVVSLVVAMQQTYVYNRDDLLVPYREVRNTDGTVIGCRGLARPV